VINARDADLDLDGFRSIADGSANAPGGSRAVLDRVQTLESHGYSNVLSVKRLQFDEDLYTNIHLTFPAIGARLEDFEERGPKIVFCI
jgi:hypothetical protein